MKISKLFVKCNIKEFGLQINYFEGDFSENLWPSATIQYILNCCIDFLKSLGTVFASEHLTH